MYKVGKVAKLLGVAPKTISRYCESGRLSCHREGNSNRMVDDDSLREYLMRNKIKREQVGDVEMYDYIIKGVGGYSLFGLDSETMDTLVSAEQMGRMLHIKNAFCNIGLSFRIVRDVEGVPRGIEIRSQL